MRFAIAYDALHALAAGRFSLDTPGGFGYFEISIDLMRSMSSSYVSATEAFPEICCVCTDVGFLR